MIIIEADSNIKPLLESLLQQKGIDSDEDIHLIHLENADYGSGRNISHPNALKRVLELAETGANVVMISVASDAHMSNNRLWQAAMGYPNVAFCDSIQLTSMLQEKINEVINRLRPRDDLAIELANHENPQDQIRILQHDASHAERDPNSEVAQRFIARASNVFGNLPLLELLEKTKAAKPTDLKPTFKGRELSGTFCDVQGTLIQSGNINEQLLLELQQRSSTEPVTVWTDGDVEEATMLLRSAGVLWKILPKSVFSGALVATAYDDLPEDEFNNRYNITAHEFHQVSPPQEDLRDEIPGALPKA